MNYWNDEVYEKKLQWNIWPFTEVISTLLSFKANNERLNQKILEIGCGVGNNLIPICSSVSCETPNLSVNMADFVTITGRNFGANDTTSTQRPTALTSMDPNGVNSPSFSLMSFNNAGGTYAKARVSNPGTGYTSSPNVIFSGGGCTQNPTATATVNSGKLTGLVFTAPGLGCTSSPTVAFQGGGGSEASVVLIAGAGDGVYSKGTTANGFVLTIPGNSRVGVYNSVITISVS